MVNEVWALMITQIMARNEILMLTVTCETQDVVDMPYTGHHL